MAFLPVRHHASHAAVVLIVFFYIAPVHLMRVAAQSPDYDGEISDLKEKIERVRKKCADVKSETAGDRQSFFRADSLQRSTIERYTGEKNELLRQYEQTGVRIDSLQLEITDIGRQRRNLEIGGRRFSNCLLQACDRMLATLEQLPPVNIGNHIAALKFLKGEIEGKAVENTEALERFWQILFVLNDMAGSVDVSTAPSPVPSIDGEVFIIRLGLAWLGIVEENGTTAFVWHPDTADLSGEWTRVEHPSDAAAMLKCARMYQGNAVPEIVGLPFDQALTVEGAPQEVRK